VAQIRPRDLHAHWDESRQQAVCQLHSASRAGAFEADRCTFVIRILRALILMPAGGKRSESIDGSNCGNWKQHGDALACVPGPPLHEKGLITSSF